MGEGLREWIEVGEGERESVGVDKPHTLSSPCHSKHIARLFAGIPGYLMPYLFGNKTR